MIEEQPELDLAVVRGAAGVEWHPMAVHTRTAATRLALVHGPRIEFRYRYESWVRMASRRPALRVDLTALAGVRWIFGSSARRAAPGDSRAGSSRGSPAASTSTWDSRPATNLLPLRRLDLPRGGAADAAAAWLDVRAGTLVRLPQRYFRRTASTYRYEAPTVGYAADLAVSDAGFVTQYPGLWTRVSGSEPAV